MRAARTAAGYAANARTKRVVEFAFIGDSDVLLDDTFVKGFGVRICTGGSRAYFVD